MIAITIKVVCYNDAGLVSRIHNLFGSDSRCVQSLALLRNTKSNSYETCVINCIDQVENTPINIQIK